VEKNKSFMIKSVSFDATDVVLTLNNQRLVKQRLSSLPRLEEASAADRAKWEISADGLSVTWPTLGKSDTSVDVFYGVWDQMCNESMAKLSALNWDLEALDPADREIVALWRLEADGYNGGFMQFFCNWGERTCDVALDALRKIGAHATFNIVKQQRQLLSRLEDSPELVAMEDLPKLLTPEESHQIYEVLDPKFWEAAQEVPRFATMHYLDDDGIE
jgi:hypothetical protein